MVPFKEKITTRMPDVTFITKTTSPRKIVMDSFFSERSVVLLDNEMVLCTIHVKNMDEATFIKCLLWRALAKIKRGKEV